MEAVEINRLIHQIINRQRFNKSNLIVPHILITLSSVNFWQSSSNWTTLAAYTVEGLK